MSDQSALITKFIEEFQRSPTVLAHAPVRINLAGEHVDYNEGIVLPAAIDREVRVAAAPLDEPTVTSVALDLGERVVFRLDQVAQHIDKQGCALPACEQAAVILHRYLPGVKSLRDVSSVELAAYSDFLPDEIRKRA